MAFAKIDATVANSSAADTLSCDKPAGTAQNDIMFALVFCYTGGSITSSPAGWTLLASSGMHYLYYKVAGASEPASYTWEQSASVRFAISIITYRDGFDTANPIESYSNTPYTTSDKSIVAEAVTTSGANHAILVFAQQYGSPSRTHTAPATQDDQWAEDLDTYNTDSRCGRAIYSDVWSGSGSTGTMTVTTDVATSNKHAFAVALNPPSGIAKVLGKAVASIAGMAGKSWASIAKIAGKTK
ncbi:MAG TPA: hypothetical protein PLF11_11185 [Bacillota bacterium]|nr:hypothetical protein [Bacillota bacterium]